MLFTITPMMLSRCLSQCDWCGGYGGSLRGMGENMSPQITVSPELFLTRGAGARFHCCVCEQVGLEITLVECTVT